MHNGNDEIFIILLWMGNRGNINCPLDATQYAEEENLSAGQWDEDSIRWDFRSIINSRVLLGRPIDLSGDGWLVGTEKGRPLSENAFDRIVIYRLARPQTMQSGSSLRYDQLSAYKRRIAWVWEGAAMAGGGRQWTVGGDSYNNISRPCETSNGNFGHL